MEEYREIPDEVKHQMVLVLKEYINTGVISTACGNVGVPLTCHKEWVHQYPKYAERLKEVKDLFVDGLETIAIQRAKEKSDSLMALLLRAHRPEVYGDRSEVNHKINNAPIQLVFAEGMLSEEEKKIIKGEE